jgi:hypothetical protein
MREGWLRKGVLVAVAAALVAAAGAAGGSVVATPISADPYTNPTSQHRTQVEPDSFGYGNTVVATFQTGRFVNGGGASNIAWSTTTDAGRTWTTGVLPGTTINEGGTWARISDPSVAYDPLHDVWMISTLAFGSAATTPFGAPSAILTSRSTDGGLTWDTPVVTAPGPASAFDKNWITCDTWPNSPYYGNCYTEWDDFGIGGAIFMSTSTDGGLTWSAPTQPTDSPSGLGGQPVVQPNGDVIVPYAGAGIQSFRSVNGGISWDDVVQVANVSEHPVAGNLRTSALPSAEVDGQGTVYVVWQDCRFRTGCTSNDIVMSTSTNGLTWTAPVRIPIDPVTSGIDHFIPGIAVDRSTQGSTARLALGYYYYPVAGCNTSTCDLTVGFTSSTDGGATWAQPKQVAGPFRLAWIAQTDQGPMVGDYISTSFAGGPLAFPIFAIAKPPVSSVFNERAAAARFDVTAPQVAPPIPVRRDPVRYRGRAKTPLLAKR